MTDFLNYDYDSPPELNQDEYLVNGKLRKWSGPFQTVTTPINPSSEPGADQILGHYPLLDSNAALEVLAAAEKAYALGQGEWPTMHPLERSACVRQFLGKMRHQRDQIIELLMWEIGKSYKDAANEFDRTVIYVEKTIEFYQRKVKRLTTLRTSEGVKSQIHFSPRGITLCMGPYNYPLNETFTVLIPALITGNVVIFKPPRLGVLLHQPLLQALAESFPPGVVNTIYGEGQKVISPLMTSGKIDVLAFIGSSRVADIIRNQHPLPHRLYTVLGLEAKNPGIVCNNCNIDNAVHECLLGSLSFNGQRCTALKIIFVQNKIADIFVKKFAAAVDDLVMGAPWDPEVNITPLPESSKIDFLNALVEDAENLGAKQVNLRGGLINGTRYFPTVLYPVSLKSRVANEEQFGPVVPIVPFEDFAEVADYVAKSPYGQQASIFTSSEKQLKQAMQLLGNQISRLNINSQCQRGPDELPFTGRKDSAQGVLSVREALRAFSTPLVLAGKSSVSTNKLMNSNFRSEQTSLIRIWKKLKKSK